MLAGLIIVVLVGFLVWFCTATKPGRACASWLQVVLSWLWLTRVSALALLALLLLPWIAHSCARSLLIGVYDLDGHDASGFYGALFSGLLLVFACWTVFVTAALTLSYGKDRTQFADEAPAWFAHRFRDLLWISLGLNVWTIIAATDPADRKTVALTLLLGLVVGLIVIWVIEQIHERINHYPMAAFHFVPHGQRNAHPLIKKENISENIILGPLQRLGRR